MLSKEYEKSKSIVGSLLTTFRTEYIISYIMSLIDIILSQYSPFMMQNVIDFLQNKNSTENGYKLIAYVVLERIYGSLKNEHVGFRNNIMMDRCRQSINCVIYSKQFRLTPSTRGEYGPGQLFTMMKHDVDKVVDYTWGFAGHVMTPINLIQCIYYLTQIFGISFMAGVSVFCLGTYINTKLNEKIH